MKKIEKVAVGLGIAALGVLYFKSRQVRLPKGVKPLKRFDILRYLGKWYEIARFDYKFENNLINVTAEYLPKADGSIKVKNNGYNVKKKRWETSIGEAQFVGSKNRARLKVSFFKYIWSGYNVIDIDKNYKYALVVGHSTKYLWILSREKTIPEQIKNDYLAKAQELGFPIENIVWTEQE